MNAMKTIFNSVSITNTMPLQGSASHHSGDMYNPRMVEVSTSDTLGIFRVYYALVVTYEDDRGRGGEQVKSLYQLFLSAKHVEAQLEAVEDEGEVETLTEVLEFLIEHEKISAQKSAEQDYLSQKPFIEGFWWDVA